jgi:hypothetical protein
MGALDYNTEETNQMIRAKTFCLFSLEHNDNSLSVKRKKLGDQIMAYLDTDFSESDTEEREPIEDSDSQQHSEIAKVDVLLNIFRVEEPNMFLQQTKLRNLFVKLQIHDDFTRLLSGILGATTTHSTQNLGNCFPHPSPTVSTSFVCTAVSRFTAERLAMKAGPDATEVLANSLWQDINPEMDG